MVFGFGSPLEKNAAKYATPWKEGSQVPQTTLEAQQKLHSYDYVIVGGGTAGSVLASRLSENPSTTVLLLEAGGTNEALEARVPLMFSKMFKNPKFDWEYYTEPQPDAAGREHYWPRGKMLGGSSSLNAMMYHSGSPSDLDEWANKFGCKGWSFADLDPYRVRAEHYTPNPLRRAVDASKRGQTGQWKVGHSHWTEAGEKGFSPALENIGIPYRSDVNTFEGTIGHTAIMTFIDQTGKRSSAATAYLPPSVQSRSNLTIGINVLTTKVLLDGSLGGKPRAFGVELQQGGPNGPKYHVAAQKEVIISAGAVNTPQLLLLSGIGPRDELQKHSIPVVHDSPHVGKHLKDHYTASMIYCRAKPQYTLDYLASDIRAIPALLQWLLTGKGPLTNNAAETAAFFSSNQPGLPIAPSPVPQHFGSNESAPDLEFIAAPMAFIDHGAQSANDVMPGHAMFTMGCVGLRPQSEGEITLKDASAWTKAQIDPKYCSHPNDVAVLIAGIRVALRIARSKEVAPFLEPVEPITDHDHMYWPWAAPDPDAITDAEIEAWLHKRAFTLYHPVSTARMSPDAAQGVVDLDLKVHGIDGLRLCDASCFPEQIAGHPCSTVIAVAERFADILQRGQAAVSGSAAEQSGANARL